MDTENINKAADGDTEAAADGDPGVIAAGDAPEAADAGTENTADDEAADPANDESADSAGSDSEDQVRDQDDPAGSPDSSDDVKTKKRKNRRDPDYNGPLPLTFLAALVGLILGLIPASVYTFISMAVSGSITGEITGNMFYPFFIAAPLLMYLFNRWFRGCRDTRAIVVFSVFSLISAYFTALFAMATLWVYGSGLSILNIPVQVAIWIGALDYLPISVYITSFIFPLLFTALGVVIAAMLLRYGGKRKKAQADADPDPEEAETEPDAQPEGAEEEGDPERSSQGDEEKPETEANI